jgi:hypothetical protein
MPNLTIVLEEGFTNDQVLLRFRGRELLDQKGVTTRLLLGFALEHTITVAKGEGRVEVLIPSRGLQAGFSVSVNSDVHVSISVEQNRIFHSIHTKRPGYL